MNRSPRVAVLITVDSKFDVALHASHALKEAGASPWVLDLSLRPHTHLHAELDTRAPLDHAGPEFAALHAMPRAEASQAMTEAGAATLRTALASDDLCGVIGIGGANGSTMACGMMRELPYLLPKALITPVAATAAVQWYVAQSDIAMFPSIGDISLNRITRSILENAARAITAMSAADPRRSGQDTSSKPLIGVSTFGNLQMTVDRITSSLEQTGAEVIHFHASGPGGRALESLALAGELQGIIDLTTSELADFVTGGVYRALIHI